jgi:hypothetical protein
MSRLINKVKLGFVQLGRQESEKLTLDEAMRCEDTKTVARLIASYVGMAPAGARFMSPCSGYGVAEHHMCEAWEIPTSHRWFAEMHDGRAEGAKANADYVICGDALGLNTKPEQFDIAYLNPPFDTEGTEQGNERFEYLFFDRFMFQRHNVVPGGIGIYVAPQYVLAMEKIANHVARVFDDVRYLALPADLRKYGETVMIGIVRKHPRKYAELLQQGDAHRKTLSADLPELEMQPAPLYTIPTPPKGRKEPLWHNPEESTPANALRDVISMGGAWTSSAYTKRQKKLRYRTEDVRPLFPPTKSGAILGVASGKINNKEVVFAGRRMRIKGNTRVTTKETTEVDHKDDGTEVRKTHSIVQRTPFIVTVDDETGAVGQYMGDKGIEHLADISGAVDAMIETYKASVPPIYDGIIPDDINAILDALAAGATKVLPGQAKPQYMPMQKHIASAIMKGFEVDPQLLLNLEMRGGKAQPLYAKVLTPTGWKQMGDISVGDSVIGSDGKPHQVTGVFPQGEKEIYSVTFSDGASVQCCADHLWAVKSTNHRYRGQPGKVLALREFMEDLHMPNGNARWYVPMVAPVEFPTIELPLDPYLLGVLIGDGNLRERSTEFASADQHLVAEVQRIVSPMHLTVVKYGNKYNYGISSASRQENAVTATLHSLGLAGKRSEDKFIPADYLRASVADRVSMLQGLVDTDGYVRDNGCNIEYMTVSRQLKDDVVSLVQSLGGTAPVGEKEGTYTKEGVVITCQHVYRINITLPAGIVPARLPRKLDKYTGPTKFPPSRAIVKVEKMHTEEAQCIQVDAPDSLYVTDGYVVTHNTRISLGLIECLRLLRPTNEKRAFTAIVTGPATVIGSREALEQHDLFHADPVAFKKRWPRGKTPKPLAMVSQWTAEIRDILPHWDSVTIETPSQFRAFIERAKYTDRPIVGIMSLSWLALGMGRVVGTTQHPGQFPETYFDAETVDTKTASKMMARQSLASDMAERSKNEFKVWQETERAKAKKTQRRGGVTLDIIAHEKQHLLSKRTVARDRLFRCGTAGRSVIPAWHFGGEYCPDCGRQIIDSDGNAVTAEKIYRDGNKGHKKGVCRYCKTKIVSSARVFDSIKDINVPVFDGEGHIVWPGVKATEETPGTPDVTRPIDYLAWYEDEQDVVTAVHREETNREFEVKLYEGFKVIGRKCVPFGYTLDGGRVVPMPDGHGEENRPQRNNDGTDKVVTVVTKTTVRGSLERQRRRAIPWGIRPKSNPRMALGEFAKKAFSGQIDVYIADEVHKHKGRTTDQGAMFAALVAAAKRTLGLTGTVYGGKASTVFSLLQRLNSKPLRAQYSWDDEQEFVREMGIVETITTETIKASGPSRKISGRGEGDIKSVEKERAGITASLAQIIWAKAVVVLLKQMGFTLPKYTEDLKLLSLPTEVQQAYQRLESWGIDTVKQPGGRDCLSSWLQACLVFPYAPWDTTIVAGSRTLGDSIRPAMGVDGKPLFSSDMILPHHRRFTEMAIEAKKKGLRSIIFVEHTRKVDLQVDIQRKMIALAAEQGVELKIDIMRSNVKGPDRLGWFSDRADAGVDVVLCHPALVDTGVSLVGWPIINFAEPGYKLATAMQAKKRAYGPMQTNECIVDWWAYAKTMGERAIGIISAKMLSAALLSGDDVNSGIFSSDDGMSMLQALAKQIVSDKQEDVVDIRAQIRAAGQATVKDMTQGAAELFGAQELFDVNVPTELSEPEMIDVIIEMPEILEMLPTEVAVEVEVAAQTLAEELSSTMTFRMFSKMPRNARKGIRKGSPENDNVLQAEMKF